jgi:acetoin utilization protein AcuA
MLMIFSLRNSASRAIYADQDEALAKVLFFSRSKAPARERMPGGAGLLEPEGVAMDGRYKIEPLIHETPVSDLKIYPNCAPGFFKNLVWDSGIGAFAHYSSIIQKTDVFERVVNNNGRVALVIAGENTIVAYLACWYPEKYERWSKLGDLMFELGAIEVSRNYRKLGLARTLIKTLMAEIFIEHKIAYMNGFMWHWDIDGTGLTLLDYRRMLINLLKEHGFKDYYTNEPNIALRPENVFMARIGGEVSDEDQKRFSKLRFGIVDKN